MSGSLIGGVVGAVIGFFVGGPSGAAYGFQIGAFAGAVLMPGKLPGQEGPRLEDLKVQTSTYGVGIPILYGRGRLSGNIIWTTDLIEHSNTQESGGKGGGPSQSTTTYSYTVSCAIGLCEGPVAGIRRVWADSTLIYDASTTNTGPTFLGSDLGMKVYLGTESQLADPTIEAALGVGNVPAYRGMAYVVFTDFQLEKFGNRIPIFSFEVVGVGTNTYAQSQFNSSANLQGGMAYNPLLDEVWSIATQTVGADPFIVRQAANTGAAKGGITSGSVVALTSPLVYDSFAQSMWAFSNAGNLLIKIDAATAAVLFSAAQTAPLGLHLDPQNGTLWLRTATGLRSINKTTGATVASYSLGFTTYAAVMPGDGGIWLTAAGSPNLYRFDQASGGVETRYVGTGTLTDLAYDSSRNVVWAIVGGTSAVGFDLDTSSVFATWLLTVAPSGGPGTFAYEPAQDALWTSNITTFKAASNSAANGSQTHYFDYGGTESQPSTTGTVQPSVVAGFSSTGYGLAVWDTTPAAVCALIPAPDGGFIYGTNAYGNTGCIWPPGVHDESSEYTPVLTSNRCFSGAVTHPIFNDDISAITPEGKYPTDGAGGSHCALITVQQCPDASWTLSADKTTCTRTSGVAPRQVMALPFGTFVSNNQGVIKYQFDRVSAGVITLADIITDISERTNRLTAADINVTQQTQVLVDGYVITRQATARSCIEQLQLAYFFDAVESGSVVKFVNRGSASILAIPDADLAAFKAFDTATPDDLSTTRLQETELPRELNVIYQALNSDFQTGTQQSRRLVGATGDAQSFQLPLALTDDKAKQVADTAMFTIWTARTSYQFTTTNKYAKYEPTDVVTVKGRTLRLTKRDEQDGVITWQGVEEEPSVYAQYATGVPTNFTPQSIQTIGATDLMLLDIPMLRDTDDDAGVYVAANGFTAGAWPGAVLYKSSDNGASYASALALATASTIGRATTVLGNSQVGNMFDFTKTVTVSLIGGGTLSSATQTAVLNGANACLLGNEVLQFLTATLNADGSYTLAGLLRGRRGTEWAMGSHAAAERFVLLSPTTTSRLTMATAEIGLERLYKGVTIGDSLQTTGAQAFTDTAVALECYSPVHLAGGRNTGGDLTIEWVRRTRLGGEWRDNVDVPVGEATESYDAEIWDSTYTALKRTYSSLSSPTATYTAAQQTTDFGSAQAIVYVKIFQNSAVVGRGYPLIGSL